LILRSFCELADMDARRISGAHDLGQTRINTGRKRLRAKKASNSGFDENGLVFTKTGKSTNKRNGFYALVSYHFITSSSRR
jgi:hypothetical protein